ncbi:MAG: 2-succinyl-5-enolpyruvyl-6-hydroxy-3-cyclohexene-1-carboxylic-acid synthase [Cyclobacteriaceae bacterium]
MILQPVIDIAEICALKGVKKAIICPGSRNAPLTLAFARHESIDCLSVPDERSGAFIALGIALKTKEPVVLICTSGSAAYNFAPAVAEAFFLQIPLIVLTADRPKEWIAQLDGQTIFQENIYGSHVKQSYSFPTDYSNNDVTWHCHRMVNEAINKSIEFPQGPVHINIPLREPFYPEKKEEFTYSQNLKTTDLEVFKHKGLDAVSSLNFDDYGRILIIAGQAKFSHELNLLLSKLSKKFKIPILGDIIANLAEVQNIISAQDLFLKQKSGNADLKPELIITYGKSVISKNLKLFLRGVKPANHWHIQSSGDVADTFQSLTKVLRCNPFEFFTHFLDNKKQIADEEFFELWQTTNAEAKTKLHELLHANDEFSEFKAFMLVMDSLPGHVDLHLANSMAVRYANFIGLNKKKGIEVFANRGTSGIDGSVSTAIGAALSTEREVYLLIGDMAFFYDRNAFWQERLPSNLKIVVFNNHGGGIFRMIDGPSQQPELNEFFETRQKLSAKHLAEEYNLSYKICDNFQGLSEGIVHLEEASDTLSILEVETKSEVNERVFKKIIKAFG